MPYAQPPPLAAARRCRHQACLEARLPGSVATYLSMLLPLLQSELPWQVLQMCCSSQRRSSWQRFRRRLSLTRGCCSWHSSWCTL